MTNAISRMPSIPSSAAGLRYSGRGACRRGGSVRETSRSRASVSAEGEAKESLAEVFFAGSRRDASFGSAWTRSRSCSMGSWTKVFHLIGKDFLISIVG